MNREYNTNLIERRGPHVLSPMGIGTEMFAVIVALMPTLMVGTRVYGARVIGITLGCIIMCLIFEIAINFLLKRYPLADNGTCIVTGLIIALNLPANVPLWIMAVACAIAIIIVKGPVGEKRNVINPAATAICFVYICLIQYLDLWPVPLIGSPDIPASAQTAYSGLQVIRGADGAMSTNWELFLGFTPGPFGCVSAIAIMLGCVYLICRRVVHFIIPLVIAGVCAGISVIVGIDPLATLFNGGLMMGACFMATDPVTSPNRLRAMVVYGAGIGLITMIVRLFVPFMVDGIYIAIVLMNLISPHLDKFFVMEKYKSVHSIIPSKPEEHKGVFD